MALEINGETEESEGRTHPTNGMKLSDYLVAIDHDLGGSLDKS